MTKQKIDEVCDYYYINNYTINNDMTVDIDGSVELFDAKLEELPLNFNRISGGFDCDDNFLTSLKGAPKYVGSHFFCSNNRLESLKYSPEYVGYQFYAFQNKIKTLEYFPEVNSGSIIIDDNPIEEIWWLFRNIDYVRYFNELDIIQENGEVVILDRLNYFLTDIGKKEIDKDYIKNYKVK